MKRFSSRKSVADAERDLGNAKKIWHLEELKRLQPTGRRRWTEFAQQDLDRYIEGDTPLQLLKMEGDIALAEEEIKRAEEKLASTRKLRKKAMRLLWKCRATNSPSRNNKTALPD